MQLTAKSFKFAYPDYASDADKAEFEQKINQVLAYLCQSETAQKILQQAAKSGVTIKLFDEGNNNYYCRKDFERERGEACLKHGQPHTVLWNPKISYIIENPVDGIKGELSPAMIFLHEMVHAIDDKEMFVHMDEMIFNTYFKTAQAKLDKINEWEQEKRDGVIKDYSITTDPYLAGMVNSKERFAVEMERAIAAELGEPVRYLYVHATNFKRVDSPLDSARSYIENGKIHTDISKGHPKDINGSIYTKNQSIEDSASGKLEQTIETEFNKQFKPISEVTTSYENDRPISIKTTDYRKKTITTENMKVSENGTPIQEKTVTDLNGMPISRVWGNVPAQPQVNPKEIDWNKISNKDLYAAILSGDTQSRAALSASFAQSDAGMALKARGAELYAEQQEEQRQQAFQRELEQMREQAEQRRQQEAEQQQSQSLSRGIRR